MSPAGPLARSEEERLAEVAAAALAAFTEGGFRLTQMAHVSRRLGVSVGHLYSWAATKEALFHLAVLAALGRLDLAAPLPLEAAGTDASARAIRAELLRSQLWPTLRACLAGEGPADEAAAIGAELYDTIALYADLVSLLDRCAHEIPSLAEIFDRQIRRRLMSDLEAWTARRPPLGGASRGEVEALARGAMEAVAWLAKTRRCDPTARGISEARARAAAILIFRRAMS